MTTKKHESRDAKEHLIREVVSSEDVKKANPALYEMLRGKVDPATGNVRGDLLTADEALALNAAGVLPISASVKRELEREARDHKRTNKARKSALANKLKQHVSGHQVDMELLKQ